MRTLRTLAFSLLPLLLLLIAGETPSRSEQAGDICIIAWTASGAYMTDGTSPAQTPLAIGDRVMANSTIYSSKLGNTILRFDDASLLVMAPLAGVLFRSLRRPELFLPQGTLDVELIAGRIMYLPSPLGSNAKISVNGTTVESVRMFQLSCAGATTTLYSPRGAVRVVTNTDTTEIDEQLYAMIYDDRVKVTRTTPASLATPLYPWPADPKRGSANMAPSVRVAMNFSNGKYTLDASQSTDPDGDPILRWWWVPLDGPIGASKTLTSPLLAFTARPGVARIRAFADDGFLTSHTDISLPTHSPEANNPPVANFNCPLVFSVGFAAQFDASVSSDPEGDPVSFRWRVTPSDNASITTAEGTRTTFTATAPGNYTVVLAARDLYGAESSISKVVKVVARNFRPTATANIPFSIPAGKPVKLESVAKDAEGVKCLSLWRLVESADPDIYSQFPMKGDGTVRLSTPGEYKFVLQVTDGEHTTDPVEAVLHVLPNFDAPQIFVEPCIALLGETAFVDITGSFDGSGIPLQLAIRYLSGPVCALTFISSGRVEFTPRFPGIYRFFVCATGKAGTTENIAEVIVTRTNSAPSAAIKGPEKCSVGEKVIFVPFDVSDPDDDPLSFEWTVTSHGDFTASSFGSEFSFRPPREGTYRVRLVVSDGLLKSTPVEFSLLAIKALNRPKAKAIISPSRPLTHATVSLSAAASRPAQVGLLTFRWSQTSGPPVELKGTDSIVCTFVPVYSSRYEFTLTVSETQGLDAIEVVEVVVSPGNTPPVAIAPSRIHIRRGEPFTLHGSLSYDPDGDEITGKWLHIAGASILTGKEKLDKLDVNLRAESSGTARFQLTVNDGKATSLAEVEVVCFEATQELTAIEPPFASLAPGSRLKVAVMNAVNDTSYRWFQIRGIRVSFNETGAQSEFTFTFSGVYEFGVVATRGTTTLPAAYCIVAVAPSPGIPVVHVFGPSDAKTGTRLTLEAAVTGVSKGDVEFQWRQITGPLVNITRARKSGSVITVTPMEPGIYEFDVSAVVGTLSSTTERIRISLTAEFPPPRADAGPDMYAEINTPFTLDASNSRQAGGASLSYIWRQVSGPAQLIAGAETSRTVQLNANAAGVYTLALTVNNGVSSATDDTVVRVKEVNRPPCVKLDAPCSIEMGDLLVLDVSASLDPDSDPMRYAIHQLNGPPVEVPAQPRDLPYFVLTLPQTGSYEFEIIAEDGISGITSVTHTITVGERSKELVPDPGVVKSNNLLDLAEAFRLVSEACNRDMLPTPSLLENFRKGGPLEKRIGPLDWTAPRENLPDLLAFELSAIYRDPHRIEKRRSTNLPKFLNPSQMIFSRDYSFLADEPADICVYSYPGVTDERQVDAVAEFLRRFLAAAYDATGFSVSRRDMQIVVHMPLTGHLRVRNLIACASSPRPSLPKPTINHHFFPDAGSALICIPDSVQNVYDVLEAVGYQSVSPGIYCDPWLRKTALKTPLTSALRDSVVGWLPRNSLLETLAASFPWLVWTLESSGDIRVTVNDRGLLERNYENVWDCGSIAVFVPPAPLVNTPFGSTLDFIRNSSPMLSTLWTPHDKAVFIDYDPRGRLVLCNSPRALAYTLEVLWKTLEQGAR